jgi:hypothetical protein
MSPWRMPLRQGSIIKAASLYRGLVSIAMKQGRLLSAAASKTQLTHRLTTRKRAWDHGACNESGRGLAADHASSVLPSLQFLRSQRAFLSDTASEDFLSLQAV